eukprot:CAMPEP_0197019454 /NCGR_PEP_ID=MMETSP1380-20130617/80714_1 /TAXON_ID=5936 /ORGANISM="Euplotes crassus, Strain CT5" /LENGTH=123 /DNA_ID=CAMNT_0042446883 /DNA_START=138 /DNA_END=509 /DNA_ORIENTATION=-
MIKSERLKDYMVHLHITPGLIEDYKLLVENITKRSENYSSSERLPMIVIIIRLKLHNLQEEDVDLKNLQRDVQNATKGAKPLVHIFDFDSKSPDWAVEKLVGKMMNLIIQDLQLYLDSNIYDL